MICVANFNSYITFNLKIYLTNRAERLDEAEFCEFEIKRFPNVPARMLWHKGLKGEYKKISHKNFSRFASIKEISGIITKCRLMDATDNYNYKYVFSYTGNQVKIISRTQIKDMYYVPNKRTAYYLNTLYCKISLNLNDGYSNNLMYSIISSNINKCAYSINMCCEPVTEHNPSGIYLNVSSCNTIKSKIKFKTYSNADLLQMLKLVCRKNSFFVDIKYGDIPQYAEGDISYNLLKLVHSAKPDNVIDMLLILTGSEALDYYVKGYNRICDMSYQLAWDTIILKPQDIKYMDVYDLYTARRCETKKYEIQDKIKQNKRAEKIAKGITVPKLFDVFGNVIMK